MDIYVFGNMDLESDRAAFAVADRLQHWDSRIRFIPTDPNADVPFADLPHVYILDTLQGINTVTLLTESDIDHLVVDRGTTAHDYDLGFQLKYLKKLGKIKSVTIIALPMTGPIDYDLIQSIFKKLVEQDMHGS